MTTTTVDNLLDRARSMLEDHRDQAAALGASYKFQLGGEGACTFVLDLRDPPAVHVGERPADCTFRMSSADFVEMAEGRVDSRELFFGGRLRIDGDMGLALKLKKLRDGVAKTATH